MGAWDYGPMENDYAQSWLTNEVEAPLMSTIKRTLQAYLAQTEKDDITDRRAMMVKFFGL